MAIEFRERSVSSILFSINAFWSSSLMQDRHIIDQAWRGYLNILDNLYTQLYQLNYAKCINTISHNWISHWERFDFNASNRVETFNSLYPYAYTLPKNIKSVYLLRESPREISLLPAMSMILNNNSILLPDGSMRYPGDIIYSNEDWFKFKIDCPACNATGFIDGDICEICDGTKIASGVSSESGFGVETVKYYKRADDIADYDEGIYPLGDFVVDEANKIIAFKTEPYSILWSEFAVRDTEIIYDNFGSLLQFYKKDSYRYLRQLQGLWYTYWHGSTIKNLEIGLNVVTDLPFITDPGYVENITYLGNTFLTQFAVPDTGLDLSAKIALPVYPAEAANGMRDLIIVNMNKPEYAFVEGVDYEIIHEFEDAHDYENWYSFTDFNSINSVPSQTMISYIKLLDSAVTQTIEPEDKLNIYFKDGSGSYIITVAGRDYVIPDEYTPEVVVNQYMQQFEPLTEAINVYDYINYPKWWENLLGYASDSTFYLKNGRVRFDSIINWDSGVKLDSYRKHLATTEIRYYHTFLVSLEKAAIPTTIEDVKIIKAYLDTIKPSYSHYIIRCTLDFYDDITTRQAHFGITGILNINDDQGPMQRFDDSWIRKNYDRDIIFDKRRYYENLLIAKLPLDGLVFISDIAIHSCTFDSLEGRRLDSGKRADSYLKASNLTITKELP